MHIEKQHGSRVLIIPNPHMDTPQYEVLRVKNDESVAEARYDISIKQAVVEEAKMPKFDKEAVKPDEPVIQAMGQGMVAPKLPQPEERSTESTIVKTEKPTGFFAWLKGLFSPEEVKEEPKPEVINKPKHQDNRAQRVRQGQRRGNSRNNRGGNRNDDRTNIKNVKSDETKKSQNKAKTQNQPQTRKPEHDKNKQVKEEVVKERRQRRSNRKKVRVNKPEITNTELTTADKKAKKLHPNNDAKVKKQINSTDEQVNIEVNNTEINSPELITSSEVPREERPRNRRSPRHLRSNGQRRRHDKKPEDTVQDANSVSTGNEQSDVAVEARYPTHKPVQPESITETETPIVKNKSTIKVTNEEKQQVLPFVDVEEQPKQTIISAVETPSKEQKLVIEPIHNPDNKIEAEAGAEPTQIKPVEVLAEVTPTKTLPEVETEKVINDKTITTSTNKTTPTIESTLENIVPLETNTESKESTVVNELESVKVAELTKDQVVPVKKVATQPVKKSPTKDKKLARQVRKANRLPSRASSPMTKTETITTMNALPRSFMANEDRMVHQVSGRTAIAADATSRSSAGMTKAS
jgi:ribonuclease E